MPRGKVQGRRPGRPPGAKNKPKVSIEVPLAPIKVPLRSNGVRRTRRTSDRVALAGSIIQINRKHMLLIQKWSGETKIGVQQIFDDIMLAGAGAAYKSFYRGLINSRKAAEAQFDAEADTERVAKETNRESERVERLPDSRGSGPARRPRIDEEQLSLAPLGPGQLEETDTDLEAITGLDMGAAAQAAEMSMAQVGDWAREKIAEKSFDESLIETDAPSSAPPIEEEPEPEEPDENEPPY